MFLAALAGCSDAALGAPVPGAEGSGDAEAAVRQGPLSPRGRPGEPAPRPAWPQAVDGVVRLEAERLAQVRATFARSPEAPLALLDAHRAEFPYGKLAAERELIAIDALLRRGRAGDARARAQGFLARFPSSPHAARVRRLTGAAP